MKKYWKLILGVLVLICLVIGLVLIFTNSEKVEDSELFASEYTQVDEDNVFVYKSAKEIIQILENGTGVVYLGFPECKWCQAYVPYLDEVAKENNIDKIYYFNIREDREKNTADYKKIVELTSDFLLYNDEGEKRVFVPDIYVVLDGEILSHNNETSMITEDILPIDYWTDEKLDNLKKTLKEMFTPLSSRSCTTCN